MNKPKRFTSKYPDSTPIYHKYYLNGYHYEQGEFIDKLGRIEDIEEKLGINLDIFVHAMLSGICVKRGNGIEHLKYVEPATTQFLSVLGFVDLDNHELAEPGTRHYCFFKEPDYWLFENYGKTWALTKEELENEEHSESI